MSIDILKNVKIKGISCVVPDNLVKSESYNDVIGKNGVERFVESTGIKQRYTMHAELTCTDLCYEAAENLIKELKISKDEIDGIVFVSETPDYKIPANAYIMHHRLGLTQNCFAYDVNISCSGYVYGLYVAAMHLQRGHVKKVLLLDGFVESVIPKEDKSQMMMSGEAGSATLLEYCESNDEWKFQFSSIGENYKVLVVPAGGARHTVGSEERVEIEPGVKRNDYELHMDGREVFNFGIKNVPKSMDEFFKTFNCNIDNFDLFVLHQANLFILNRIIKKLGISKEKVPLSIEEYGNTSSVAIPITLCKYFNEDNCNKNAKNIMITGFGSGLSIAVGSINIEGCRFMIITKTKNKFNDGLI